MNYLKEYFTYLTKHSEYPGCDALRAIACISVFIFHTKFVLPLDFDRLGYWGVDLFFVLSGFLIGHRLFMMGFDGEDQSLTSQTRDVWNFYKSRFLRIYPIYLSVLIMQIFSQYFVSDVTIGAKELLNTIVASMLMLHMSHVIHHVNQLFVVPGSWSLVIEWWFYISAPLLLIICARIPKLQKHWVWFLIAVFLGFIALRMNLLSQHHGDCNWSFYHWVRFQGRADEILAGFIAYLCVSRFNVEPHKKLIGTIGMTIIICFATYLWFMEDKWHNAALMTYEVIIFSTILGTAFACIVISSYKFAHNSRFINAIARLSYPIYLVHTIMIGRYCNSILGVACASVSLSLVLSFCIEYPFIRYYSRRRRQSQFLDIKNDTGGIHEAKSQL